MILSSIVLMIIFGNVFFCFFFVRMPFLGFQPCIELQIGFLDIGNLVFDFFQCMCKKDTVKICMDVFVKTFQVS